MLTSPDSNITTAITYVTPANNVTFQNFTTRQGLPSISLIPGGEYHLHYHASTNHDAFVMVFAEIWEVNNTGYKIAKIGDFEHEILHATETQIDVHFFRNETYFMNSTESRIQVEFFAHILQDAPDVTLYFDGVTNAGLSLPSVTVDATNFVPYTGAVQDVNLSTHNLTAANIIGNVSTSSSYFREFWQWEGTALAGTWGWTNNAAGTDYSSVRNDGAGYFNNNPTHANNDEYYWDTVYLTSGSYQITYVHYTDPNSPIMEFLLDSVSLGTVDCYSAGTVFNVHSTINFTLANPVLGNFRFKVSGKNASSLNYFSNFERIRLVKTGG